MSPNVGRSNACKEAGSISETIMSTSAGVRTSAAAPTQTRLSMLFARPALLAGAVVAALALSIAGPGDAWAKGGTDKPVKGTPSPFTTPTLPDPVFVDPLAIHGFYITGFIQDMTVDSSNSNCPNTSNPNRLGGTIVVNGTTINVPCNSIIQMPAN